MLLETNRNTGVMMQPRARVCNSRLRCLRFPDTPHRQSDRDKLYSGGTFRIQDSSGFFRPREQQDQCSLEFDVAVRLEDPETIVTEVLHQKPLDKRVDM